MATEVTGSGAQSTRGRASSPRGTRALDFIVIGASKSGTTTLFQYLRTDPDFYLPPEKDAPFFAVDEHWEAGWERFAAERFAAAPPEALWGTVTPRYMEDARVPVRIAAAMPEVRLIALLRNPVDRAFSQYRQQVRRGKEPLPFADRVDRLLAAGGDDSGDRILSPGRYGAILGRFREHFPGDRLLVLFADDLASETQAVVDRVRVFLGLPAGFVPPNLGRRFHEGGRRERFTGLVRRLARVAPLRRLWRLLPRSRRAGLWTWFFTQVNVVREAPEELPAELRRRLADHYRLDVAALERMIGRPVPWHDFREDGP